MVSYKELKVCAVVFLSHAGVQSSKRHKTVKGAVTLKIQQSAEDYLETILVLGLRKPQIRSIDIANELGYSKPSVSVAMKNLRENGYISMDREGYITLEESGRKIAETIYERHTLLTKLLTFLGVSPETAAEDACRMEHVISPESFEAIKTFARNELAHHHPGQSADSDGVQAQPVQAAEDSLK